MPGASLKVCIGLLHLLCLATPARLREGVATDTQLLDARCSMDPAAPTLYDTTSISGASCRIIIHKKDLALGQDIVIKAPAELLGADDLRGESNRATKLPVLVTPHSRGQISESDVIARYLLDVFQAKGPSFVPSTIEARLKSSLLCRLHDNHIATIQGCLYEEAPPFGKHHSRFKALQDLRQQLLHLYVHNMARPFK